MNLKELKDKVDNICEFCDNPEEIEVCITTSDNSVGPRAKVGIKNIYIGFDWEINQCRIDTKKEIISKEPEIPYISFESVSYYALLYTKRKSVSLKTLYSLILDLKSRFSSSYKFQIKKDEKEIGKYLSMFGAFNVNIEDKTISLHPDFKEDCNHYMLFDELKKQIKKYMKEDFPITYRSLLVNYFRYGGKKYFCSIQKPGEISHYIAEHLENPYEEYCFDVTTYPVDIESILWNSPDLFYHEEFDRYVEFVEDFDKIKDDFILEDRILELLKQFIDEEKERENRE